MFYTVLLFANCRALHCVAMSVRQLANKRTRIVPHIFVFGLEDHKCEDERFWTAFYWCSIGTLHLRVPAIKPFGEVGI